MIQYLIWIIEYATPRMGLRIVYKILDWRVAEHWFLKSSSAFITIE